MVAVALSTYLALSLRNDGLLSMSAVRSYLPVALLPLVVRPFLNERFGLYRRLWGHASVPDLIQILRATIVSTLVCLAVFYVLLAPAHVPGTDGFPRGFWIAELVFSLGCIGGSRFLIRALSDAAATVHMSGATVSLVPALLYGAGQEGAMMARSALRDSRGGVMPVGFLDDDRNRHGATVAGLSVFGGLDVLDKAIRLTGARMLLITMPNADGASIRRVMDRAQLVGIEVRTVPGVHELLDGSMDALRIRRVKVEDLLTREQVTTHAPGVAEVIRDQVIMVTGAGGSIGSELARQLYGFNPRRLVLVDRAESPLYLIQRELELRALSGRGSGELSIHLANVASRQVIGRIIAESQPAIIFHAAACKHVPMMEEHPSEGVQVNVGGTMSVLGAATEAGVPRFVLVSTDKAVEPSSVMGATKRLAEWLVADAARQTGRPYVSVRFGNVLGSAGSVLPIFQSQLENGEPLTVTHPDMTRYFMTIQEAGWLILDAGAIGRPGDLFVLDMGEPVKIVDMARDLIRLSGRAPDSVPIRFTGFRPGEKLTETLFYKTETVEETDVTKILRVLDTPPPFDICSRAKQLLSIALGETDEELRAALFAAVHDRSVAFDEQRQEPVEQPTSMECSTVPSA
jgi:FlaA1/EpsC-like NDP-sugar epimerase